MPWLRVCLHTSCPLWKRGISQPFRGVLCLRDLLMPVRPAAAAERPAAVFQLCTLGYGGGFPNCSARQLPSFWALHGDAFLFKSIPSHGSHPLSYVSGVVFCRVGFGKLLIAACMRCLCSPQTHAAWREGPWNQMPQGGWDLLPSVPGKNKAICSPQRKKYIHIQWFGSAEEIYLWVFIPGLISAMPQNASQACETKKTLNSLRFFKFTKGVSKKHFLPLEILDACSYQKSIMNSILEVRQHHSYSWLKF